MVTKRFYNMEELSIILGKSIASVTSINVV